MAIGNGELMHDSTARVFSQTLSYGNSKDETNKEGKKRGVSMERSTAGTKTISLHSLSKHNQNVIIIDIIL